VISNDGTDDEERGRTAVEGTQETCQGSRYCGTVGSPLVHRIDAFSTARHPAHREAILRKYCACASSCSDFTSYEQPPVEAVGMLPSSEPSHQYFEPRERGNGHGTSQGCLQLCLVSGWAIPPTLHRVYYSSNGVRASDEITRGIVKRETGVNT
jgi:hypothetical protein